MLYKNIENIVQVGYSDKFGTVFDFENFKSSLEEGVANGLCPGIVVFRDGGSEEEFEILKKIVELKKIHKFSIFLDISRQEYLFMLDTSQKYKDISEDIDFINLEMSKLTGLTSGILFSKDREIYKNSFKGTHREYYNSTAYAKSAQ